LISPWGKIGEKTLGPALAPEHAAAYKTLKTNGENGNE
jgi:hypothetical protein